MGNQALTKSFKKNIKDGSTKYVPFLNSQILLSDNHTIIVKLCDYITEALQVDSETLKTEFLEKCIKNEQKNSEIEGTPNAFLAQKTLQELNQIYMCGYKTSESNIDDLSQTNISKFFTVPHNESEKDEFQITQLSKSLIIYGLYLLRQKNNSSKTKNFNEYVVDFLSEKSNSSKQNDKQDAGVSSGIGFVIIVLQELKDLKQGQILQKTLLHLIQTFKRVSAGSLSSNDKQSFVLDSTLNDFRHFLIAQINDKATDQSVIENSAKLIFWMGLARSSLEDFLILSQLVIQKQLQNLDMRQELEALIDLQTDNQKNSSKEESFEAGQPSQDQLIKN